MSHKPKQPSKQYNTNITLQTYSPTNNLNNVSLEPLDINKNKILQQITNEILNTKPLDQQNNEQLPDALQQKQNNQSLLHHLSPLMSTRHNKSHKLQQLTNIQNISMDNLPTLKNIGNYTQKLDYKDENNSSSNDSTSLPIQFDKKYSAEGIKDSSQGMINNQNLNMKGKTRKHNSSLPPLDRQHNVYSTITTLKDNENQGCVMNNKLPMLTNNRSTGVNNNNDRYYNHDDSNNYNADTIITNSKTMMTKYSTNNNPFSHTKNNSKLLNYSTIDYTPSASNRNSKNSLIENNFETKLESKEFELANTFRHGRKLKNKYDSDILLPDFLPLINLSRSPQNVNNFDSMKNKFSKSMIEIIEEDGDDNSKTTQHNKQPKFENDSEQIETFEDEKQKQYNQKQSAKINIQKNYSNNLPSTTDIIKILDNKQIQQKQLQQQQQSQKVTQNKQQQQAGCLFPSI